MGQEFAIRKGDFSSSTDKAVDKSVQNLHGCATECAFSRIDSSIDGAQERVKNALERRFLPYLEETQIIAKQISSPQYISFVTETEDFLDASVGIVVCPDGRIQLIAIGDPRVLGVVRRPMGLPPTRSSTRNNEPVLDDPDLAASIDIQLARRIREGKNPELIEFIGIHIHSTEPIHGCGAFTSLARGQGHSADVGTKLGGIKEFFTRLDDHFYATDNNARRADGKGTTIDLIHDAYSEGLIFGLRDAHSQFDPNISLRENLKELHDQEQILMTELLDGLFREEVLRRAYAEHGVDKLDIRDPHQFAKNARLIGTLAREITEVEEKNNFNWIPKTISKEKSQTAIKALAYLAIRNSVYRILGGIRPGMHDLTEHPERLLVVGPTAPAFNRENIPFIHKTARGPLQPEDITAVKFLYALAESVMEKQDIDLKSEGRIILVTEEFKPGLYRDKNVASEEYAKVKSAVRNNAARIRIEFSEGVKSGETIVLGCIHDPGTRQLLDIC